MKPNSTIAIGIHIEAIKKRTSCWRPG